MQKSLFKKLSKRIYPSSQRMHRQPAAKKLAGNKKISLAKIQKRYSPTIFGTDNFEVKKKHTFVAKRIAAQKTYSCSSLIVYLELEHFVSVPVSVCNSNSNNPNIVGKQELPK